MVIQDVKNVMMEELENYGFRKESILLYEHGKILKDIYSYKEEGFEVNFILTKEGDNNCLMVRGYMGLEMVNLYDDWVDLLMYYKTDKEYFKTYVYGLIETIRQSLLNGTV